MFAYILIQIVGYEVGYRKVVYRVLLMVAGSKRNSCQLLDACLHAFSIYFKCVVIISFSMPVDWFLFCRVMIAGPQVSIVVIVYIYYYIFIGVFFLGFITLWYLLGILCMPKYFPVYNDVLLPLLSMFGC